MAKPGTLTEQQKARASTEVSMVGSEGFVNLLNAKKIVTRRWKDFALDPRTNPENMAAKDETAQPSPRGV